MSDAACFPRPVLYGPILGGACLTPTDARLPIFAPAAPRTSRAVTSRASHLARHTPSFTAHGAARPQQLSHHTPALKPIPPFPILRTHPFWNALTLQVLLGRGDQTLADDPQLGTLRSTLAEVIAQAMETGSALNMDFTVVNAKGDFPSADVLRERLAAL